MKINSKHLLNSIPSMVFLLLFLRMLSPLFLKEDVAFSVVPGWHTIIFPRFYFASIIIEIITFIHVFCYFLLFRLKCKVSILFFIFHLLMFLPFYIFIFESWILLELATTNYNAFLDFIDVYYKISMTAFVLIELIFIFHFIKSIGKNENRVLI